MVPVHDTDIAEERWTQGEWENYELWEKVVAKEKKRRRNWILSTILVFLALSSVPIFKDRWQKWQTRDLGRELAQKVSELKKLAALNRDAYEIEFASLSLDYRVFRKSSCSDQSGQEVQTGTLGSAKDAKQYVVMGKYLGQELQIPGLSNRFCYDPVAGTRFEHPDVQILGFGVIPVKDLTDKRIDRVTVLLLRGVSAEMSFD